MKNILFGNGININFSGNKFTNKFILIRANNNVKNKRNPRNAYTKEALIWLKLIYKEYENTRNGTNDYLLNSTFEKVALGDFKKKYKTLINPKIHEIGFEDYFLLHDVFCYKNKIDNPERFEAREVLKRMFLDAIYFNGEILKIFKKFPHKLILFFQDFENLFTTNYDNNVEVGCRKKVHYLHGAFHILDDIYNPNSFRNQLSDTKDEDYSYTNKTLYLFSNALSTYSGDLKEYSRKQSLQANSAIEKMATGYLSDPKAQDTIESWKDVDNDLVNRFREAIILKAQNKEHQFQEYYPIDEFLNIRGQLTIIGLAPYNDSHIFKSINENEKLENVIYYYFDYPEKALVENLLPKKEVHFKNVTDFWVEMGT